MEKEITLDKYIVLSFLMYIQSKPVKEQKIVDIKTQLIIFINADKKLVMTNFYSPGYNCTTRI